MTTNTLVANLIPSLNITDRCERCGARAFAAVRLHQENTPMFFCSHHYTEVEPKIIALHPYSVRDERNLLDLLEQVANVEG